MNFVKNKVYDMKLEDVIQLTKDYELFEKQGSIGDCLLRKTVQDIVDKHGLPEGSIGLRMDKVAFEAYRYLADLFLFNMGLP